MTTAISATDASADSGAQGTNTNPNEGLSPDDLNYQMTEAEEQAYVNEQLGISSPAPEKQTDQVTDQKEQQNGSEQQPTTGTQEADNDASGQAKTPEAPETPKAPEPKEEPKDQPKPDLSLKTDDLWVEVEKVVFDEDGNQSTEKVKLVFDPANPDSFLPDDFKFKSDKQLMEILEAKAEMAQLVKTRNAEIEAQKSQMTEAEQAEKARTDQLASWDDEIQTLIDNNILPAPKVAPTDPKFLEDPSAIKIDTVFKFMATKNEELTKDGKPLLRSFAAAYTLYENDAAVKAAAEAKAKEDEDTKARGAMVGGTSAQSAGSSAKGYVPGSYASIYDVPVE